MSLYRHFYSSSKNMKYKSSRKTFTDNIFSFKLTLNNFPFIADEVQCKYLHRTINIYIKTPDQSFPQLHPQTISTVHNASIRKITNRLSNPSDEMYRYFHRPATVYINSRDFPIAVNSEIHLECSLRWHLF